MNQVEPVRAYPCDSKKNTDCKKTGCYERGGPCKLTLNPEYAKETEIMIEMPREPKAGDTITFYENIDGEIYASLQFSAIADNGVINIIEKTEEQDGKNN